VWPAAVLQVLAFVQEHTEYKQAQLAGNSIHVDRVYLQRYMPQLTDHLHYRIVDVSTLKELCR
jgi:oligoribonuclease